MAMATRFLDTITIVNLNDKDQKIQVIKEEGQVQDFVEVIQNGADCQIGYLVWRDGQLRYKVLRVDRPH